MRDVEGTFKDLAGRGVEFIDEQGSPIDALQQMPWGATAAWFRDPDGNVFFFIEESQGSAQA